MKRLLTTMLFLLVLLSAGLIINPGCDTTGGGAEIYLENISVGNMTAEGKAISGLPSQEANVVLKISAKRVGISTSENTTVINISPSGASIIIGPDSISINGVEPDQIEMKWQVAE